jgi:hypothetical protein
MAQAIIADPITWEWMKEKIGKVIKQRYLITADIVVKSYINYFAVPKGMMMCKWSTR